MNRPMPDAAAVAHSRRVQDAVVAAIESAGGWISFAAYMQLVLHAPGLGYYSAGSVKFGADGDFVTAPELSPIFAGVCARQIDLLLRAQGGGALLELGPGTGAFALTAIDRLRQCESPLYAYELLEISADLRERHESVSRIAVEGGRGHRDGVRRAVELDAGPEPERVVDLLRGPVGHQHGLLRGDRHQHPGVDVVREAFAHERGALPREGAAGRGQLHVGLRGAAQGVDPPLGRSAGGQQERHAACDQGARGDACESGR